MLHSRVRQQSFNAIILISMIMSSSAFAITPKDRCLDCHKDIKFNVQNRVLYEYYNQWKDSTHDVASVSCSDCHGGDPTTDDKDMAHKKNFSSLTSVESEDYKKIPAVCGKCHKDILKSFISSKHFTALIQKGKGPHCATCHGSVNINVYYTSAIARVCQECHNAYTKNSPSVVGEADKILHRINVAQAYRRWILFDYQESYPEQVNEIIALYDRVAESWHTFNFKDLDMASEELLQKIKAIVNKRLKAETINK